MKNIKKFLVFVLLVLLGFAGLYACKKETKPVENPINNETPTNNDTPTPGNESPKEPKEVLKFKVTVQEESKDLVKFEGGYQEGKEIEKDTEVTFKIDTDKLVEDKKVLLEIKANDELLEDVNGVYKIIVDKDITIKSIITEITEGLTYEEISGTDTYLVRGNEETKDIEKIVIPHLYEGKKVSKIEDFSNYQNLKEVTLPNTINKIMDNAFRDSIDLEIFKGYKIPGEESTFTIEDGVIFSKDKQELFLFPVAKTNNEKTYRIPQNVIVIGEHAFAGIKTGDEYDPEFHDKLETVILPNHLKQIKKGAFENRNNLKVVKFNSDDENEPGLAEEDYKVEESAFEETTLKTFPFQEKLIYIGDKAFKKNKSVYDKSLPLKEVKFSERLTYLGKESFFKTDIEKIEINGTFTEISNSAFAEAKTESFVFGKTPNLKKIGEESFKCVSDLKEVILPEGIEEIGKKAFADLEELITVSLPKSLEKMDVNAFAVCKKLKVENISFNGNENFLVENGVLYNKAKTKIYKYTPPVKKYELNMPDTVEEISMALFNGDKVTRKVILSKSLKEIPALTFMSSQVMNYIFIPKSITFIDGDSLRGFPEEVVVEFEEGSELSTLGEDAFGWSTGSITLKIKDVSIIKAFIDNEESGLDNIHCFLISEEIQAQDLPKEFTEIFEETGETKDTYKEYKQK